MKRQTRLSSFCLLAVGVAIALYAINLTSFAAPTQSDLIWLRAYKSQSTNVVVWDKRFEPMLRIILPKRNVDILGDSLPLKQVVRELLGGPPDDVRLLENRYIVLSACRFHSATEKGLLWLDTISGKSIFAAYIYFFNGKPLKDSKNLKDHGGLYITSTQYRSEKEFPPEFNFELKRWLINAEREENEMSNGKRYSFFEEYSKPTCTVYDFKDR